MAQPLAVPFPPHTMLPAAYMMHHPLSVVPEGDITMHETDPYNKDGLRIDECHEEHDAEVQPRAAKRSRMSFHCDECGTSYTEKRALARHRHTDQHRKKLGLPPNKKHSCSVCGKLFGRGHDLKRHYNEQHPTHAAGRTTPGSNHSGEAASSGASDYGSEHAFSTDGAARTSTSPMTAATALSHPTYERCSSSASLPDEKPSQSFNSPEQPLGGQGHSGAARKVRTLSDLHLQSPVPVIRMDRINEMDITNDSAVPSHFDPPHLRPSASMSSLAERSDTSQYGTDLSVNTPATDIVPDTHPSSTKPAITKEESPQAPPPLKPNDDSVRPMACTMCSETFEDDLDELLIHLRRHLADFKGEYRCHECFIGFVHEEDLTRHQQAAAKGDCGFNFPHVNPCTGHHPPAPSASVPWENNIPDSDSFRLCNKLRHWEQSQLSAYVSEVNSLIASRKERKFERWSVGEIMRGPRNEYRISVNTYASAPCDVDEDGKYDIGGLQQRLKQMSLKKAGTSLKSIIRKQRVPDTIPDQPPAVMSRNLHTAISKHLLPRAERLIREGVQQQRAVQYADASLTAEALWGQSYIQHRILEHRTLEGIEGRCSRCNIKSTTFENGLGKIKVLIAHGADPNQPGGLCGVPLNTAAWMGKADVVKALLYNGAKLEGHVETRYGSPLCTAAAQGDSSGALKVVNMLIDHRADVHFRGPEGSALDLAKKRMEALAMEAMGMTSSSHDHAVRSAWCHKIITALEKAERCMTPPMTGTLYCADNSLGNATPNSPGVATFRSFRPPASSHNAAGS